MTLDDIMALWSKDCDLDRTELGEESLKIPQLHSKYFNIFSKERLLLRKLETDQKVLHKQKYEWFNGTMDIDDLTELSWEPNPLKILRTDIGQYIDADQDIIQLNLKLAYQKEKVEFLENAIRSLNSRGFNIKSAIDWEKFKVGL
jgi:hypothetical protein|tara:strand:+ start:384 stop:818 length:435 start_codon:yes stop_codon:yes gene_type:complete